MRAGHGTAAGLVIHYLSIEQLNGSVGMGRIARIVRHHTQRGAVPVQFAQQFHHRFAVPGVEIPRRLVGKKDGRIAAHGASHGHALLLTSG